MLPIGKSALFLLAQNKRVYKGLIMKRKQRKVHRLACLLVAVLLAAALPGCGLFKQTANNKETQEGDESMGIAGQVVVSDKAYKEGALAYMQEKYGEEFKLTENSVAIVDNVYAGRGEDVYPHGAKPVWKYKKTAATWMGISRGL